jgi:hypothetical protein
MKFAIVVLPLLLIASVASAASTTPCDATKNQALCTEAQAPANDAAEIAAQEFPPAPVDEAEAPIMRNRAMWSDRIRNGEAHPVRGSAHDRRNGRRR